MWSDKPPEHRPGDQLAQRIERDQQSHYGRRSAIMLRVERQQRQDDGEPEYVNGDDQEYRKKRRFTQEKTVRW